MKAILCGVALVAFVLVGCTSQNPNPNPSSDPSTASLDLGNSRVPEVLASYSIRVEGTRNGDADPFYQCADSFSACVTVNNDGTTTVDGDVGIGGLCATSFTNAAGETGDGMWIESCHAAYRGASCETLLTDIDCVINGGQPADLEPGINQQTIVITEEDAGKIFTVIVCHDDGFGNVVCTPAGGPTGSTGTTGATGPTGPAEEIDAGPIDETPDAGPVDETPDAGPVEESDASVICDDAAHGTDIDAAPTGPTGPTGEIDAGPIAEADAGPVCSSDGHAMGEAIGLAITFANNFKASDSYAVQDGVGENEVSDSSLPPIPNPLVVIGLLDTDTRAVVTANGAVDMSSATTVDLDLLAGIVRADLLTAVATASAGTDGVSVSSDGTRIVGLTIAGVAVATVEANVRIELPLGLGYVIVNEVESSTPTDIDSPTRTATITVNLLRVHLDNPADGSVGDIIVSHATAHAEFTPTCP